MAKIDRETVARGEFYSVRENHFTQPWEEQTEKVRKKYFRKADEFIKLWGHLLENRVND